MFHWRKLYLIFIQMEGEIMKKYFAIFKYGLKMNTAYIIDYLFSIISFSVHVIVFNGLWDFILKDGSAVGYTKNELIWYIIMAEFLTYSISRGYQKLSEKVKDGTIANMLLKPISIPMYFMAEESSNLLKIFLNLCAFFVLGFCFGGALEVSALGVFFVIISCILSIITGLIIQLILGLIAFEMEETKSLWFIVQKFQFLVLFVPLEFYSGVFQKILFVLPTTHIIYAPSRLLVKFSIDEGFMLVGIQVISIILLSVISAILYKRGVEKINANGG